MRDALYFLFETMLELIVLVFLLRLILQMVRADFYNPLSQAILRLTNPLVVPARRTIPSMGGFDLPGAVVVLVLQFAVTLALWGLLVARDCKERFGHLLAVGVTALIFWQVFINVGMVIGILPVVGVTLPLMSYGGSSVMTVFLALGLLANVSMRRFVNWKGYLSKKDFYQLPSTPG